jgi:hypothetical protein
MYIKMRGSRFSIIVVQFIFSFVISPLNRYNVCGYVTARLKDNYREEVILLFLATKRHANSEIIMKDYAGRSAMFETIT